MTAHEYTVVERTQNQFTTENTKTKPNHEWTRIDAKPKRENPAAAPKASGVKLTQMYADFVSKIDYTKEIGTCS
jgi:hypothetical protein